MLTDAEIEIAAQAAEVFPTGYGEEIDVEGKP